MAKCRFFEAEHSYPRDECDPAYCWRVLGNGIRKRPRPLSFLPDPNECAHQWEDVLARVTVKQARVMANPKFAQVNGRVVTVERRLSICTECGLVRYTHESLGELVCIPSRPRKGASCRRGPRSEGIYWSKDRKKWTATIYVDQHHSRFVGRFASREEAIEARRQAIEAKASVGETA